MERISALLHRKLGSSTLDECIIMFAVCFVFLPFEFPLLAIVDVLLYLCATGKIKGTIWAVPKSGFMIVFCLLTSAIIFINDNLLNGVCNIGILLLILFIFYSRTVINKRLFELLMNACCIISLFCLGWAMIEYCRIVDRLDYSLLQLKVESGLKGRTSSAFFSANYYAMMTEFIILICVYKVMQVKTLHRIVFYVVTVVCDLFALYLSDSRAAWIPFVVAISFMFLINKQLIYFITSIAGINGAGILLLPEPKLVQWATVFQDLVKRSNIQGTAVESIQAHPLLEKGLLTYFHVYKQYHRHPT